MFEDAYTCDFADYLSELSGSQCDIMEILPGINRIRMNTIRHTIYCYADDVEYRIPSITGVPTIHIDEDQIRYCASKLKSRLKGILKSDEKIFARNTVVARVNKENSLAFQEEHHLQRALPGKYRYGLFHNGELVTVAVFSGGRKMNNEKDDYRSFELLRFCHKNSSLVIGGMTKIIKAFVKDFRPNDIMTYVDMDWSQHSGLTTIGFKEKGRIPPQYYWINASERVIFKEKKDAVAYQEKMQYGSIKSNSGSIKMVLHL